MMNKRTWLTLMFAAIASVALVACGGARGSVVADQTDASAVAAAVQDLPVVDESVAIQANEAPLDANAIVAAYEEVLGSIYDSVLPSVVQIRVEKRVDPARLSPRLEMPPEFERFFDSPRTPEGFTIPGEGSGFVWSDQGHIITNHHVIEDADRVTAIFADGSEYEAEVLGSDPTSDLAVLKIDPSAKLLSAVSLGDSSKLKVGQLVVAIGSPFGQDFTMTSGIVSALGRTIQSSPGSFANPRIIQTDAPINPGNSGGPLIDREGRVIGINSQIISNSGASAGIGFAVPIDTAKRIVPELMVDGKYEYAFLGISGISLNLRLTDANGLPKDTRGVLIVEVVDGSPAEKSGLLGSAKPEELKGERYPIGGDIITGIDGTPVRGIDDLIAFLAENYRPEDKVTLDVLRDGQKLLRVNVTLSTRPEQAPARG